jgi:hypothetical protein
MMAFRGPALSWRGPRVIYLGWTAPAVGAMISWECKSGVRSPMNPAVLLISLVLLAACAKPASAPVAAQSACPETMPDVDRVACWVSAGPEPAPAGQKPPSALLRGPDGTAIIGPKPSE